MKLYIKYMVSIRCKMAVRAALDNQNILYRAIELGEADIIGDITEAQRNELRVDLLKSGLKLMDDKKAMLIEKIKNVIVEMIHYADEPIKINFSHYLSEKLDQDYAYLSTLFSEVTGTTIEHYIIAHKIEKVKELLLYDELSLTEISYQLNYSSVAHLSNQFKKVTGLSPTYFKNLKQHRSRIALEDL
jgi:YesN/AraC family two-component response regulator